MRRIHRAHTSLFANGLGKIPIEALVDSGILLSTPPGYCQKIRIRASDVLGNKYITEYLSLGASLAYPVFREPWLGKDIVPRPVRMKCPGKSSTSRGALARRTNPLRRVSTSARQA
jgi:hypothetical protein